MGNQRHGRIVSGIGIAMAAGVDAGAPPAPPFSGGIQTNTGTSTANVTGASGTLSSPYFSYGTINGVAPVTSSLTILDNGGGKLSLHTVSSSISQVVWAGMLTFEHETITLQFEASDSAGGHVIDTASITVTRIS